MPTATDTTEWPSVAISPQVRELINLFFSLTESKSENAGARLAEEVFVADGKFVTPHGTYTGTDEISQSRKHAWSALAARRHAISKVYASDIEGKDIMMLGRLVATTKEGNVVETSLVARVVMEDVQGKLKFRRYQAQSWNSGK